MLRVWAVSGKELAAIPVEDLSNVWALKQQLREVCEHPASLQQLMHEGASLEDRVRLDAPMDVQLVLLPWDRTFEQKRKISSELWEGCDTGHEKLVRIVLKTGVGMGCLYFNPSDHVYYYPLDVASRNGHVEVVRVLLAHAYPTSIDVGSSLEKASSNGHVKVVRLLLEAPEALRDILDIFWIGHSLEAASANGHAEVVSLLLGALSSRAEAGRQSFGDEMGRWKDRALCMASYRGRVEVTRLLLAAGTAPDSRDRALCKACGGGHAEVASLLLAAGTRRHKRSRALVKACGRGHVEVTQLLSKPGVATHKDLRRAFAQASGRGHLDVERVLRKASATLKAGESTLAQGLGRRLKAARLGAKSAVKLP